MAIAFNIRILNPQMKNDQCSCKEILKTIKLLTTICLYIYIFIYLCLYSYLSSALWFTGTTSHLAKWLSMVI